MPDPTATLPLGDACIRAIAEYVTAMDEVSEVAYQTAHLTLLDALGCATLALRFPACTRLLGPLVPGTVVPYGVHIPGTAFALDPVQAAFQIGLLIRWLDYNDTWLAAEWGHPSDTWSAILATAAYTSQIAIAQGRAPVAMRTVLNAAVHAYEIQGILSLDNSLNRVGIDHAVFVRIATAAIATQLLGGDVAQIAAAVSQAWCDGGMLRVYRHAPNAGSRKSWAAADGASRGVWLAMLTMRGELGYPGVISTPQWGFADALWRGHQPTLSQPLGSYVMEHILFKVAYPAEFHAQTAVEAAIQLHPQVVDRLDAIDRVVIRTQESAIRIIDRSGPLHNPADRDHCLQYMTAIGLICGDLTAEDYEDARAADPRIDRLRARMVVEEDVQFSQDYRDPAVRSIANSVQVFFADGTATAAIAVHVPLGHRQRRAEALPLLTAKLHANLRTHYSAEAAQAIAGQCVDREQCAHLTVPALLALFTP